MLGYLPTWAIYFAVYDGIKTYFGQAPLGATTARTRTDTHTQDRIYPAAQVKGYQPVIREHPWSLHILSAMAAGAASTMCTNPLWFIKTRFMVRAFMSCLVGIFIHVLSYSDSVTRRSQIPPYIRRCNYHIQIRRSIRFLSWIVTKPVGHFSRRRSIPVIRETQGLGS